MSIQNLLIIDKNSGVPAYVKHFSITQDEPLDQDILFSGMMSAIGTLMKEMELGGLKNISTENYDIYGVEGPNFVYFIIGKMQHTSFLDSWINEISVYINSLQLDSSDFPSQVINYLDTHCSFMYSAYERSNYKTILYKYSPTDGIENITSDTTSEVKSYVINHFRNLNYKLVGKDHVFLDKLKDGSYIMGGSFNQFNDEHALVLVLNLRSSDIISLLSYRHHFIKLSYDLLKMHHATLMDDGQELLLKNSLIESLAIQLEDVLSFKPLYGEFQNMALIYEQAKSLIPSIISTLFSGVPIAFIGGKESVRLLIEFVVYITLLFDVEFDKPRDNHPKRLTWCPAEKEDEMKKKGYATINLDGKDQGLVNLHYFRDLHKEIREFEPTEGIVMYREMVSELLGIIDVVLNKTGRGAKYEAVLETYPKNMQQIITTIFEWFNPNLVSDEVKRIKEDCMCW